MRDALMLELHEDVEYVDPETARKRKIKRFRLVARAMVNAALKGDTYAFEKIADRIDGKVPTEIRGGGKNGAIDLNVTSIKSMSTDDLNALAERLAGED